MKEEALKLAYEMGGIEFYDNPNSDPYEWACDAQRMILRLVEELDKKSKPINHYEPTAWINHIKQTGGDFYELNVSGRGEPLYRHPPQTKPLSDEEIDIIKYAVGSAICSLESEINEQEKTFKGYEHCSNLSGLREELNDCLKAKDILERHGIK